MKQVSKLRESGQRLPFGCPFGEDLGLRVGSPLGDPAAQFLCGDRPVLLLVSADDADTYQRRAQWKALLTSGFSSTTRAQMPIGRPSTQQGEKQGTIAIIVAAIAKP